jgi:hypothetical protein
MAHKLGACALMLTIVGGCNSPHEAEPEDRTDSGANSIAVGRPSETPINMDPDAGEDGAKTSLPGAAAALAQCSISPVGDAEIGPLDIPSDPRHGAAGFFDSLYPECVAGGFDLFGCAGQTAQVTSVPIDEASPNSTDSHYWAHVIALGDAVCCVYKSFVGTPGLVSAGCGPAYVARAAIQRCKIIENPTAPNQTLEMVSVPPTLSADQLWTQRAAVCDDSGYDLSKCAGEQATLVTVVESATLDGHPDPMKAWILTHGSDVCCIWETDGGKPEAMLATQCSAQ